VVAEQGRGGGVEGKHSEWWQSRGGQAQREAQMRGVARYAGGLLGEAVVGTTGRGERAVARYAGDLLGEAVVGTTGRGERAVVGTTGRGEHAVVRTTGRGEHD
jgi:hypothetical protein